MDQCIPQCGSPLTAALRCGDCCPSLPLPLPRRPVAERLLLPHAALGHGSGAEQLCERGCVLGSSGARGQMPLSPLGVMRRLTPVCHAPTPPFLCVQLPYGPTSRQYRWVADQLAAVDRAATPWLLVLMHAAPRTTYAPSFKASEWGRIGGRFGRGAASL